MLWTVFIRGDGFFAAAGTNGRTDVPVVVLKDGLVHDSSVSAAAAGVTVGMSRRHARQNCPEAEFVAYDAACYREAAFAFYDHCLNFTPGIEPVSENEVFLELAGGDEQRLVARQLAESLVPRFAGRVRLGMATNKLVARVAAIWNQPDETIACRCVPAGHEASFLGPAPLALLWPADAPTRERLTRLGLRTFAELAAVPERELTRQFGGGGRDLIVWAQGRYPGTVQRRYPPPAEERRRDFTDGLSDLTQFETALRQVAAELHQSLAERGYGAQRLRLTVQLDAAALASGNPAELVTGRALARPESTASLFTSNLVRLARELEINAAITGFTVCADDLRPLIGRQLALPGLAGGDERRPGRDALERTVAALAHRYSEATVLLGEQLLPSRRERLLALYDPYRFNEASAAATRPKDGGEWSRPGSSIGLFRSK
jgi:DNA polymerase-4